MDSICRHVKGPGGQINGLYFETWAFGLNQISRNKAGKVFFVSACEVRTPATPCSSLSWTPQCSEMRLTDGHSTHHSHGTSTPITEHFVLQTFFKTTYRKDPLAKPTSSHHLFCHLLLSLFVLCCLLSLELCPNLRNANPVRILVQLFQESMAIHLLPA